MNAELSMMVMMKSESISRQWQSLVEGNVEFICTHSIVQEIQRDRMVK